MKIVLDPCFYRLALVLASDSSEPTYLGYSLCDKITHWRVTPYLFKSLDSVRQFSKTFPGLFYYVGELRAKVDPNEVKRRLAEHYHYQLFGDTYKGFKPHKNLFDLKLDV